MMVIVSAVHPQGRVADQVRLPLPSTMNKSQITYHCNGEGSKGKVQILLNAHHFHAVIRSKNLKLDGPCLYFI